MIKRIKKWCVPVLKSLVKGLKWTTTILLIGGAFHIIASILCFFNNTWDYKGEGVAFLLASTMLSSLMSIYLFAENYKLSNLSKNLIYSLFTIGLLLASYVFVLRENGELTQGIKRLELLYLALIFSYVWITRAILFFNHEKNNK